ncbi:MAG: phasin family protein [Janthinobacterium lividum]
MENTYTQLFDFIQSHCNPEHMMNSMKNNSAIDLSSLTEAAKKSAQTMTSANQLAAESLQSVVKRTTEVYQNNASEMLNVIKDTSSLSNPEQARIRQEQYIKSCLSSSISNAKEIVDIISKSSMEIFDVIGHSVTENIDNIFNKTKEKMSEKNI